MFNKYRRGQVNMNSVIYAVRAAIMQFYMEELGKYRESSKDTIPEPLKYYVTTQRFLLVPNWGNGVSASSVPYPVYSGGRQTANNAFVKGITFTTDNGFEGEIVQSAAFDDRLVSLILPPTNEFPIAKVENGYIFVMPANIQAITLTYFRLPIDFLYATNTDSDGRGFSFNQASSIDTDINAIYAFEIAKRATTILGIPYQNPDVSSLPSAQQ